MVSPSTGTDQDTISSKHYHKAEIIIENTARDKKKSRILTAGVLFYSSIQ
jgi:hypothetical protein